MADCFPGMDWIPEAEFMLRRRYRLLRLLRYMGHAGRRVLARELGASERALRNDIMVLRGLGLVMSTRGGISITEQGIYQLEAFQKQDPVRIRCIALEDALEQYISCCRVHVAQHASSLRSVVQAVCTEPVPWKAFRNSLDTFLCNDLSRRGACVVCGNLVLSESGRPLYRICRDQEPQRPEAVLACGELTGPMMYAVMIYCRPRKLYITKSIAEELLKVVEEKREYYAGCGD